jgi:hypothetical protein
LNLASNRTSEHRVAFHANDCGPGSSRGQAGSIAELLKVIKKLALVRPNAQYAFNECERKTGSYHSVAGANT